MVYLKNMNKFLLTLIAVTQSACMSNSHNSDEVISADVNLQCESNIDYARAKNYLRKGELEISSFNYELANYLFNEGIELLGDDYSDYNTNDDTIFEITSAQQSEKEGDFIDAAVNRRKVLGTRLYIYHNKLNCEDSMWRK